MDKHRLILHELLELAYRLNVKVRRERLGDEDLPVHSGLAWVDHVPVLFIDPRLSAPDAVDMIVRELSGFDLEEIYIKPGIRALFSRSREDDATAG